MTSPESIAIGHIHLRWGGTETVPGESIAVELAEAADCRERWESDGALHALQAISPLSALPLEERNRLGILAVGPGAALTGLIAEALGCSRVDLVLHPDDRAAY
mgnify:FL=1